MPAWVAIIRAYLRVGIMNELQYRANFWTNLLQAIFGMAATLAGLGVVFYHTDNLSGWSGAELAALVGMFYVMWGIMRTILMPSMQAFMESVRQGTLDYVLLKPADDQLLVSIQRVTIWSVFDVILGFGVIGTALVLSETQVSLSSFTSALLALLNGSIIVYSFYLMLSTCAFWFIKIENILVIFNSLYQAGRWPVGIYPLSLRFILTFLIPVAFAVTVPAEAIMGRVTPASLLTSTLLAISLLLVSRWFWRFGLRYYSGASA